MKIGIIVYSQTGNTLKFGEMIQSRLADKGHEVVLTQVETDRKVKSGSIQNMPEFKITNLPDCSSYDVILVGGPVWGGNPAPVFYAIAQRIHGVSGKKAMPFVTMAFPFKWLGGKQSARKVGTVLAKRDARVETGEVICRMFHNTEKNMAKAAERIAEKF